MTWVFTGGHQKSISEVNKLVHNVLQAPDFNIRELATGFNAHTETCHLDHAQPPEHADDPSIETIGSAALWVSIYPPGR